MLICIPAVLTVFQAELSSLQGVTMDSTKLLTEKLTLARELSTLRPEMEHLRSQVASQQSLLADKLSLQRQLSTCQVELDTERRSTQRALAKESRLQAQDSKSESQLEELHAELAKERRERQKAERQAQKISTECESQRATLESRLDSFKNRLKVAKDQLEEEQTKKQSIRLSNHGAAGGIIVSGFGQTTSRHPQKRNAAQMDSETTLGTPGIHPASKKSKRGSTLPGDKSTFSITPFLNRTASVAPGSPVKESSNTDEENESGNTNAWPIVANASSPVPDSLITQPFKKSSNETRSQKSVLKGRNKSGQTNTGAAPTRKKSQVTMSLEQVEEEENDEAIRTVPNAQTKVAANKDADDTADDNLKVKRRKRKILGGGLCRTLFDEEDGEAPRGDRGLPSGLRNFGTLGRGTYGGSKLSERVKLGPAKSGFRTFSPLKRDRRAAVAEN